MTTLGLWHEMVGARDMARLDDILAEDCVFFSPVLHRPQQGRELTRFYLTAAAQVFNDSFHYVKEVADARHAVLEFVCDLDGTIVNGVDIMSFDADGRICEFKVMLRPMRAVQLMQERMRLMLEQMSG